ncbi:DUF2971 domain-containing protein [Plebeiibacterium marinum]|uniref:DUF2971 domain-containing protein n=1 Tax=Plebeiibacterium marinum TaxID=2992111 RepID=A0AAE3MHH3_9BACT|nr:DUF2971 domain-containing protein [Plebeiobacterium marinum]MCW3808068.1 DUF2971 domain-containing protein [Plebeiobacterium marinum]
MMDMDISFFQKIYNEDILYHYTKTSTAIDYILHNHQLKFNGGRNSNDPIESREADRRTVYFGSEVDKPNRKEDVEASAFLHKYLSELENQFQQICFCKNYLPQGSDKGIISRFKGNEELFGFSKPRMWDQYADKYFGVCIAFSKEKILTLNKSKIELIEDDIEYLSFEEIWCKKIGDIQGGYLKEVGVDNYKKQLKEGLQQSFFIKHKDYQGENEYRIGTYYNKEKCIIENIKGELVFHKSIMLDVSGCIEAIFMSSYANDKQKEDLLNYANKYSIPLVEMNWKYDSFEARDYKKRIEFIEKMIKNKASEN